MDETKIEDVILSILDKRKYSRDTYVEYNMMHSEYGNYNYAEYSKILNNYDIKILIPINDNAPINHLLIEVFDFLNAISIERRYIDSNNLVEGIINQIIDYWENKAMVYGIEIKSTIGKSSKTYSL